MREMHSFHFCGELKQKRVFDSDIKFSRGFGSQRNISSMSVWQITHPTTRDTDHEKETVRFANEDTVDKIVSFIRAQGLEEWVNIPCESIAICNKWLVQAAGYPRP